ncbi:15915_t:CDS:2, partial [Racocetra persica]
GQASRNFDPLISNIIDLVKSILDVYENVQFNKKICDCLIDRVESVEMAIKSLKRHKDENARYFFKQTNYNAFQQLIVVLEKIQQYITDVSQLHGLRKFSDIKDIKKQFEKLTIEFDIIVSTLKLKMSFSEKEQSIRDKIAIDDDINTMTKNYVAETNKAIKFKAKIIPSDKILNPDGPSRGNVHRMFYDNKAVACKYFDNDQNSRFHYELSMLYNLNHSENILKFYGLSELDEGQSQFLVFDWADFGDLQTLYETYDLDWPIRLQLAVGICRGLLFLHGCQILHRELRCQNVVFANSYCPNTIQRDFTKIIRAAWQDDPTLRPGLHELFIQLDKLHKENPVDKKVHLAKKNHIEVETTDAQSEIIVVEENNVQDKDLELKFLGIVKPILLLEEAAENGNATAQFNLGRMYYAGMVGLNKDKEKGLQYLKMAALKNQPRAIQFLSSVKIDSPPYSRRIGLLEKWVVGKMGYRQNGFQ